MPVNVGSTSSTGYLVTPTIPIRDNLQLFLEPADEKSYSGDTALIWKDLSRVNGSGNNFTLNNITNADLLQSGYNNNFKFDGTNDYMELASNSSVNGSTGEFTIQMWVNREEVREEQFFTKGNFASNTAKGFAIGTSGADTSTGGDKLCCIIRPSNTFLAFATTSDLSINQWVNIAWTFSRTLSDNKLYMNGVEMAKSQTGGSTKQWTGAGTLQNNQSTTIGATLYGSTKPLSPLHLTKSAIGPVLFYNTNLSDDDILHNYRVHANRYGLI